MEHRTPLYLSLSIDICLVLQQKLHQLDVPIMAGHMQWGIAHLKHKISVSLPSPLLTVLLAWICSSTGKPLCMRDEAYIWGLLKSPRPKQRASNHTVGTEVSYRSRQESPQRGGEERRNSPQDTGKTVRMPARRESLAQRKRK